MRRCLWLVVALFIVGCSSAPLVVYAPGDTDKPRGSYPKLADLVPATDGTVVRLIFVHGVGDTCPGYALSPEDGWLNDTRAIKMGLVPKSAPSEVHKIFSDVFVDDLPSRDELSYVQYETRSFALQLGGGKPDVAVEAIEITWAPLTRWIKTNQLAYDSPSVFVAPVSPPCLEIPKQNGSTPPDRAWVNRFLKESFLDRTLADVVIYVGPYGQVIQRGVAEALCHAITGQSPSKKCEVPNSDDADQYKSSVFFVTHSLGSRIVFDALVNPSNTERMQPLASRLVADTSAIYMLANQLAMLDIAHIPPNAMSGDGPLHGVDAQKGRQYGDSVAMLGKFALAREHKRHDFKLISNPLPIVAFNDTNDLLTWHVPPWYAIPNISIVNVFVQNDIHWLGLVENPVAAHNNYLLYSPNDVWKAIACGAQSGSVLNCIK